MPPRKNKKDKKKQDDALFHSDNENDANTTTTTIEEKEEQPPKNNNKKNNNKKKQRNEDLITPEQNHQAAQSDNDNNDDDENNTSVPGKDNRKTTKKGGRKKAQREDRSPSPPPQPTRDLDLSKTDNDEASGGEESFNMAAASKKKKKGKKGKKQTSYFDDDEAEDPASSEIVEEEEVTAAVVTEEPERDESFDFGKKKKDKKKSKGDDVNTEVQEKEGKKEAEAPMDELDFGKKKKSKKSSKSKKAAAEEDDEEDEEAPKAANAFDLLDDDQEDKAEDSKDVEEDAAAGKFAGLKIDEDHEEEEGEGDAEETTIKGKKKPKESKEDRKDRKERRKREKEAAAIAAAKASKTDDEADDHDATDTARFGSSGFEVSQAAAYSYASGQAIGPDGTNPADAIAVTGNLISPPNSRDLQVDKLTVQAFGKMLIKDSELNLINGRRYGLIAPNGSGKSTLLHAIACGLVPIPRSLDVYLLDREFGPTEMTAVEAVLDIIKREVEHLEDEMSELLGDADAHAVRIDAIQTRLTELEADGAERRATTILKGLGFTDALLETKTKDMSGGWRMRISLSRILFVKPTLIMLDEPTNHLDLEAVVWLEEYLMHELEGHTLVVTSHSQNTLNEVCTDILHLYHNRLDHYAGNYDTFLKVRAEKDALLKKRARAQDKQMIKIKENLGKSGSKQHAQAKSKVKAMEKRNEKDKEKDKTLQEELVVDRELHIRFEQCNGGIPSPAVKFKRVKFGYPDREVLFEDLDFGIDLTSRVALVGPNGAGKSTLIKLMLGRLEASEGEIARHHHLRTAHFHQHMADQLDMNQSAVGWLRGQFEGRNDHEMRQLVGRYGLTGKQQVIPMRQLSDGQRRRVIFAYLGLRNPHLICMDEPTNALDLETIDALAEAINEFDGGVVFVTHDFRLIDQVAEEIWIVEDGTVEIFEGDIHDYKKLLKDRIRAEREAAETAGL